MKWSGKLTVFGSGIIAQVVKLVTQTTNENDNSIFLQNVVLNGMKNTHDKSFLALSLLLDVCSLILSKIIEIDT